MSRPSAPCNPFPHFHLSIAEIFAMRPTTTQAVFATKPAIKLDKLSLFSFAWAVAALLHSLSFADRISLHHPITLAVAVAAALVILLPQALWPFMLMLGLSLGNTLDWMPYQPNHILFEFIMNGGMLVALLWTLMRRAGGPGPAQEEPAFRRALFDSFAPFVRISLLLLYFYAVLHKLNWDYFNVNFSCGPFLLGGYGDRLPFLPDSLAMQWASVWGTIAVETAIPLLLCFRRTRSAAVLLGFGFHFLLALHPHRGLFSFTALLFALYLLFLPADLPDKIVLLTESLFGRAQQRVATAFRACMFFGAVLLILIALSGHNGTASLAAFLFWLGWGLVIIAGYVLIISKYKMEPRSFSTLLRVRPAAFWLVPALVAFNGLNPYLGLKTESSFSMFSNLRTEGGITNHLFIKPFYLTDLQLDLVEVLDTDLGKLKPYITKHQLITYFELRRITSEAHRDFYVKLIRHNQLQTARVVHGISNQPELLKRHRWLAAKFLYFRPVDKGPCLCKH